MKKGYTVGCIYTLDPNVDLSQLDAKDVSRYKRMIALKVPFFVAVRKTSDKRTIFAPLHKEYFKRGVVIKIAGEDFYAGCSALPRMSSGILIQSGITDKVSDELLNEIKEKNTQWQQKVNKRKQKRKREEESMWAEAEYELGVSYKKITAKKLPSSVVWRISHPLQGGSVTPR